jgi:hypothetical protein
LNPKGTLRRSRRPRSRDRGLGGGHALAALRPHIQDDVDAVFGQTAAVISARSSQHVVVLLTSTLAVKFDTRMQLRLNTVAEAAGLFNLHPMAVINLYYIPTFVVEMQPKFIKRLP